MTVVGARPPDTTPRPRRAGPTRLLTHRAGKWVVAAVWAVVAVGSLVLAPRVFAAEGAGGASELPPSAQSAQVQRLIAAIPAMQAEEAVVVVHRPGGLTSGDLTTARRLVAAVDGDGLAGQRQGQPLTVAPDRATAIFSVTLQASGSARVRQVADLRHLVGEGRGGLDIKVTGQAAFDADEAGVLNGLDGTLLMAAAAIVAILLLITYRSPVLWLLPLVCVGLADLAAQSLVYLLGSVGLTVDSQTMGIMTVLVFGVGTDYALLLVARYREELHHHPDPHRAMAQALRRAAPAVMASGATVAASLLCLLTSVLPTDRTMGPVAALGVTVAVAVMLSAFPALLLVGGRRVFWPYAPRCDDEPAAWEVAAEEAVREAEEDLRESQASPRRRPHHGLHLGVPKLGGGHGETVWTRVGRAVLARPRRVWMAAGSVLLICCLGLIGINTDLPVSQMFRGEVDSAAGQQLIDQSFPSGTGTPLLVVVRRPGATARAVAAARATRGVTSTSTPVRSGGLAVFDAVINAEDASPRADATVDRLRRQLAAAVPGTLVGGQTAIDTDLHAATARDLRVMVPLVLLLVLLVLVVLLRAVIAPLLLLATVVLSLAATLGVSRLVFATPLFRFGGLSPPLPLYGFVFLVALGCDYNIFLMARAREEAQHVGTKVGVVRALAATGGVITSAGAVLAGTFLVLDLLPVVLLAQIGFVVAVGVLLDTLLVRTVLVPALAVDLGSRLWWPGWLWRWERQ